MKRILAVALGAATLLGLGLARAQDTKKAQGKPAAKAASKPAAPAQAKVLAPGEAPPPPPVTDPGLKDMNAQASYGFGLNIGTRLKDQCEKVQLDPKIVARGIADALTDAQPAMTEEQIQAVKAQFEQQLLARQMEAEKVMVEQMKAQGEKNRTEGAAYLAANKGKPGVKTTASGLQYKVLKQGAGATPKPTDTVTINYKGRLLDGTVFDSTEGREPMTFPIANFIEGWKEALTLMKVGDTFEVTIPSELAYGEQGTGAGGPIGPNAVLVFDIELLDTKPGTGEGPQR